MEAAAVVPAHGMQSYVHCKERYGVLALLLDGRGVRSLSSLRGPHLCCCSLISSCIWPVLRTSGQNIRVGVTKSPSCMKYNQK